jgi:peptide deformylase
MILVDYNDPILTTPIPQFDFNNTDIDIAQFSVDLVNCMKEYGGVGLAANQIGKSVRAFAIMTNPIIVMFNPEIIDYTEETTTLEEACLSYPGLIVKVTRPKSIKVRFTLPNQETRTEKYTGMTARIILHELDHLDGKRFFDVVDWYEKEKVKRWYRGRKLQEKINSSKK